MMKRSVGSITLIMLLVFISGCIDTHPYEEENEMLAEENRQYDYISKIRCEIDPENDTVEFSNYSPEFNWVEYDVLVRNRTEREIANNSNIELEIYQENIGTTTISYGSDIWGPFPGEYYEVKIVHIGWNKVLREMVVISN